MVSLIGLDCSNGQPTPQPAVVFKAKGRTARIQFKVGSSQVQSTVFHLYRLKDQAFQRIMYFDAGAKTGKNDPGVPSKYSGSVNADVVTLTISALELSDAGTYYCASWSGDNTVLTVKGNHGKNLLSSSKLLLDQQQQQGRHLTSFNCDVDFCAQYLNKTFLKSLLNVSRV